MTEAPARVREHPRSSLALPAVRLPGIGPESAKLLERLGVRTIGDLLWHLPTRYKDFSRFRPLRALVAEQEQSAIAILGEISQRRTARGQLLTEAELLEEDGAPSQVRASWFGRAFIKETHRTGERVRISGRVRWVGRSLQFSQPALEPADAPLVHTGRLVPVYGLTEGLKDGQVRRWLHTAIEGGPRRTAIVGEVPEPLPQDLRNRHSLPDIAAALRQVHFPDDESRLLAARRRLAFDELLVLQLALAQRRARWTKDAHASPLRVADEQLATWIATLPFTLTAAQGRALAEVRADLERPIPMSRLLEGEVGSGKTVIAALAARIAQVSRAQTAIMAPTELLAEQHARSLAALFADGGPRHALLTSSVTGEERKRVVAGTAEGSIDVVVGTHALVEENVVFARLALAVVDEQHRFGVRQRATFREKGDGLDPHLLLTTATPIPQTLNQTVYRDLDVLVATTVIEVGIDIPNATVMVVLGADRFGLAQLHQLRGRVGRGTEKAYCVLVSDAADSPRLAAMVEQKDGRALNGFELAARDLEIRGAGEFLGERQSGAPELRVVDLADVDPRLVEETAGEADRILRIDPELGRSEHELLARAVEQLWRRYALA